MSKLVSFLATVSLTASLPMMVGSTASNAAPLSAGGSHPVYKTQEVTHELYATKKAAKKHLKHETGSAQYFGEYGRAYSWLMTQPGSKEPIRWNPCQLITWSFTTGTSQDVNHAKKAFKRVSKYSGINFKQVTSGALIKIKYGKLPSSVVGTGQVEVGTELRGEDDFVAAIVRINFCF